VKGRKLEKARFLVSGIVFATVRIGVRKALINAIMAKQLVHMDGEDINVREDTAKAYRATYWALFSIAAFVLILAILFFGGFFAWLSGSSSVTPATGGPSQSNVRR
jgi:hypothetical protein